MQQKEVKQEEWLQNVIKTTQENKEAVKEEVKEENKEVFIPWDENCQLPKADQETI